MSSRRRTIKASTIAWLVPVVFAGELALPEHAELHVGVGDALGCSGSSGTAPLASGFSWVKPRLGQDRNAPLVPIATDGFFSIDATAYLLSADAVQQGLEVVVKDDRGATVAGETKLLWSDESGKYLFGWSATSPLVVGAKLEATLTATPAAPTAAAENVGGKYELEVVGEPTPLPDASFTFTTWYDFYRGKPGAMVSCQTTGSACSGPFAIDVPATVEKQLAAELTWRPPKFTSGVAWSVRLEASPSQSDVDLSGAVSNQYVGLASSANGTLGLGRVRFPTPRDQYCVTLVITDLRTRTESRAETCAAAPTPGAADTDTGLASCLQSPSAALTEAWCALRSDAASQPACQASGGGGAGGTGANPPGGSGGRSTNVGGSSGAGVDDVIKAGSPSTPASTPNAADEGPHTSKGCQLGGSSSSGASVAGSLLALALVASRRARVRRKRANP